LPSVIVVEKLCSAGQITGDNMAHAPCRVDSYGYKHTIRIWYTNRFSIAILATRKPLSVTLYVQRVIM